MSRVLLLAALSSAFSLATSAAPAEPYGYTSREPDASGLVYYRARYSPDDPLVRISPGRKERRDFARQFGLPELMSIVVNLSEREAMRAFVQRYADSMGRSGLPSYVSEVFLQQGLLHIPVDGSRIVVIAPVPGAKVISTCPAVIALNGVPYFPQKITNEHFGEHPDLRVTPPGKKSVSAFADWVRSWYSEVRVAPGGGYQVIAGRGSVGRDKYSGGYIGGGFAGAPGGVGANLGEATNWIFNLFSE